MKKTLAAVAMAAVAVLGASAPALAAPTNPKATNPEMNHVSYWEALTGGDCTKVELTGNVATYTLPVLADANTEYTLLVLKAGSGSAANEQYPNPVPGVYSHVATGKDLSHVIYCVGLQEIPS